tara:strand:- start:1243 stop:2565 length:1323 start_codon:yes stop_codon:yes gene_type:complete
MSIILKESFTNKFLNFLIILIPISFIAGNMIININVLLLIFSCLLIFRKKIFEIELYTLDKLLITFFSLVLFTGIINNIYFQINGTFRDLDFIDQFSTIQKSLEYSRYIFLYFILRFLIEKDYFNFKWFFISCTLATMFVCIDIFFQFIFNKDIFGFEVVGRHYSGPFGDEKIAGGYLQRFSIIAFFIFPIFFYKFKSFKFINAILVLIFVTAILLSGNRMPFIMFIFSLLLTGVLVREVRRYFIHLIFASLVVFLLIYNLSGKVMNNFHNLYNQISNMTQFLVSDNRDVSKNQSQYLKDLSSFYGTWELNKFIGGGIKNFRYYCHVRADKYKDPNFTCNMHPHNYYLEILTETGIAGMIVVLLILINIFLLIFNKKYFFPTNIKRNYLIMPFVILFLIEIFPIKSTGSFFTTINTTYFFLIMSIIVGIIRKENLLENKK